MKTLHSTEGYVYLRCNSLYGGDFSFDLGLFQLFEIFTQIVSTFQFSKKNCFLCFHRWQNFFLRQENLNTVKCHKQAMANNCFFGEKTGVASVAYVW